MERRGAAQLHLGVRGAHHWRLQEPHSTITHVAWRGLGWNAVPITGACRGPHSTIRHVA